MRKFGIWIFVIALGISPLIGQDWDQDEGEVYEMVIGQVPISQAGVMSLDIPPNVKALAIGVSDVFPSQASWARFEFSRQWSGSQEWYMIFAVVNSGGQDAVIKIDMELQFNDGAGRFFRRSTKTIKAGFIMLYWTTVTSKIQKKGLFSTNGRVFGKGIGLNNRVLSQLYIW